MRKKHLLVSLANLILVGLSAGRVYSDPPLEVEHGAPEIISHRVYAHSGGAPTVGSTNATSSILYNGGPVLGTPVVYIIWYGNWNQNNGSDTPAGQQIVRDFLNSIGGSPYFNINKSYSTTATPVTGAVTFGGEASDTGSQGSKLTDSRVQAVVQRAITNNKLPKDSSGVYFVLTSSDVNESSGFCTRYCGWHTAAAISGADIKFSFVGNANRCLRSCAAQSVSPNSNPGVDGMVSVIAHELEEATSDPDLNAWYDAQGAENADKCAWTFGKQYQLSNGSWANMQIGSRNYLIQRNLLHTALGDVCAVSVDGSGNYVQ